MKQRIDIICNAYVVPFFFFYCFCLEHKLFLLLSVWEQEYKTYRYYIGREKVESVLSFGVMLKVEQLIAYSTHCRI